jgi:hypothetical protein
MRLFLDLYLPRVRQLAGHAIEFRDRIDQHAVKQTGRATQCSKLRGPVERTCRASRTNGAQLRADRSWRNSASALMHTGTIRECRGSRSFRHRWLISSHSSTSPVRRRHDRTQAEWRLIDHKRERSGRASAAGCLVAARVVGAGPAHEEHEGRGGRPRRFSTPPWTRASASRRFTLSTRVHSFA